MHFDLNLWPLPFWLMKCMVKKDVVYRYGKSSEKMKTGESCKSSAPNMVLAVKLWTCREFYLWIVLRCLGEAGVISVHVFFGTVWLDAHVLLVIRLDSIAIDAELQEKSEADLKQLAEVLQKHVDESMAEYAQKLQEDPSFDGECSAYGEQDIHFTPCFPCCFPGHWRVVFTERCVGQCYVVDRWKVSLLKVWMQLSSFLFLLFESNCIWWGCLERSFLFCDDCMLFVNKFHCNRFVLIVKWNSKDRWKERLHHNDPFVMIRLCFAGKKTHRGPTFKLSSVMVNAQAITKAQADLEPLLQAIPTDRELRKKCVAVDWLDQK